MPKGNYRYRSDRDNSQLVELDGERLEYIRTLLANLIIDDEQAASGIVSRMHEMGDHRLTHDIVPQELGFERLLLRSLERLEQDKIPVKFLNSYFEIVNNPNGPLGWSGSDALHEKSLKPFKKRMPL